MLISSTKLRPSTRPKKGEEVGVPEPQHPPCTLKEGCMVPDWAYLERDDAIPIVPHDRKLLNTWAWATIMVKVVGSST